MKKITVLLVFLLLFLMTGCQKIFDEAAGVKSEPKIIVSGSSTVYRIIKAAADEYMENNPKSAKFVIKESNSTEGINSVNSGDADIGLMSREITPEERAYGLVETKIGYDGIAVILHPDNPVKSLKLDALKRILTGEISNWSEVKNGDDRPVTVVSRQPGSGIKSVLESTLNLIDFDKKSMISAKATVVNTTDEMIDTVSENPGAIGFVPMLSADDDKPTHVPLINNIPCTRQTVSEKLYPLRMTFYTVHRGSASDEVKAFVNFLVSETGQRIVWEQGAVRAVEPAA